MCNRFAAIAMLVGIVSLAAVACGGDDYEEAASPAAATAAAAAPTVVLSISKSGTDRDPRRLLL